MAVKCTFRKLAAHGHAIADGRKSQKFIEAESDIMPHS